MFKTRNLPCLTKSHRWVLLTFSFALVLSNSMFVHAQTTERARSVMVGAPGVDSTCAVTTTGGLKCWGANGLVLSTPVSISLGTVDRAQIVLRPSDVVGSTSGVASATHFSASNQCITDTDGLLKCKGANSVGQIGIGTISLYESLKTVPGLNGTPSVAMGATHVCAVTAAGGAKCWGSNVSGKLGDSTMTNRSAPVDVIGLTSGVASISNASDHSCAVTTAGGVKCWGNNFFGKLGDGTNTERRTPVDVVGLTSGVAAVAVGGSHTCALTTGGGVKC